MEWPWVELIFLEWETLANPPQTSLDVMVRQVHRDTYKEVEPRFLILSLESRLS